MVRLRQTTSQEDGQIVTHHTWKCSKHDDPDSDEKSNVLTDVCLYCKPCDELTCNKCAIIKPHGNHERYEASKVINDPECKPKIQEHERDLEQVHQKFTTFIAEMETLQESLKENREKAKKEINDKFQAVYTKLEEEKNALLQKVECNFEKENVQFVEQLNELTKVEEELRESRKFVNDTLTFGIPEVVLFLKTQMIARMKQLCSKYNAHPCTPNADANIQFELDLTGAITALGGYTTQTTAICSIS